MNRRHYLSTYRQKRIRLILGLLLLLAVVAVSTAYLLWSAYQQTLREAEIATRDFAALIEARLEAALRNAEAELQEIARLVPPDALRADAVPRYEKRIRAELISRITSYPEVSGIRIFDAEGNLLYSEGRGEVRRVNIADSGHFSRLRASRDLQLTFSDVITGRTSGRQVLTVAQALRAEGSVARFNEELEARVRERTAELESFSYSVSHDLRTPLRGIAGIARILETDYASSLDHTGRDLLARLRESAQRMGGLIEDLLKLSRLTRAMRGFRRRNSGAGSRPRSRRTPATGRACSPVPAQAARPA
jgi:signal transduction histidine kinase